MSPKITEEEYVQTQGQLAMFATIVAGWPLEAMLAQINACETTAPFTDPTLYMRGRAALENVKRLVESAMPLKREALRQIAESAR